MKQVRNQAKDDILARFDTTEFTTAELAHIMFSLSLNLDRKLSESGAGVQTKRIKNATHKLFKTVEFWQ